MRAAKKKKREAGPVGAKKKERSRPRAVAGGAKKTERERRGREHLMHPTINAD
jgi:hypothetical protein